MRTTLVLAADEHDLIGVGDGGLPWHLPSDLRRFKQLTDGHVVVVGRLTHESIVQRLGGPLPGRLSVVVTRQAGLPGTVCQPDVAAAFAAARTIAEFAGHDEVFVIGGTRVYLAALPFADRIHLTRVHIEADGDVFMPPGWLDGFAEVSAEKVTGDALPYTRQVLERA